MKKKSFWKMSLLISMVIVLFTVLPVFTIYSEALSETIENSKSYATDGNYKEALASAEIAIKYNPTDAYGYLCKAQACYYLNNLSECNKNLELSEKTRSRVRSDLLSFWDLALTRDFYQSDVMNSFMGINIRVNTKELDFTLPRAIVTDGQVMVPLKPVFEILGGTCVDKNNLLIINYKGVEYSIDIKNKQLLSGTKNVDLGVMLDSDKKDNLTLGHKKLSEIFGLKVEYIKSKPAVYIDDPNAKNKYTNFEIDWAIGSSLALTAINSARLDTIAMQVDGSNNFEEVKQNLIDSWGITDRETAIKEMKWMISGGHTTSFLQYVDLLYKYPDKSAKEIADITGIDESRINGVKTILQTYMSPKTKDEVMKMGLCAWDLGRLSLVSRQCYFCGFITYDEALENMMMCAVTFKKLYKSWDEIGKHYVAGRTFWGGSAKGYEATNKISQYLKLNEEKYLKPIPWDNFKLTEDYISGNAVHEDTSVKNIVKLQLNNPKISIDGMEKEIDPGKDVKPIVINGRTIVPIRAIVEALGGSLEWNDTEKKATISANNKIIELWINKTMTKVNGEVKTTEVAPQISNGRAMLPLRFIAESLGFTVNYDDATKVISITN